MEFLRFPLPEPHGDGSEPTGEQPADKEQNQPFFDPNYVEPTGFDVGASSALEHEAQPYQLEGAADTSGTPGVDEAFFGIVSDIHGVEVAEGAEQRASEETKQGIFDALTERVLQGDMHNNAQLQSWDLRIDGEDTGPEHKLGWVQTIDYTPPLGEHEGDADATPEQHAAAEESFEGDRPTWRTTRLYTTLYTPSGEPTEANALEVFTNEGMPGTTRRHYVSYAVSRTVDGGLDATREPTTLGLISLDDYRETSDEAPTQQEQELAVPGLSEADAQQLIKMIREGKIVPIE